MKVRILLTLLLAGALIASGCKKEEAAEEPAEATEPAAEEAEAEGEEKAEAKEEEPAEEEEGAAEEEELAQVQVAKEGTKFEPAVQPEQLPSGVWYCDMGTVEFAAVDKPENGKCPTCGMKLKQYNPDERAAKEAGAVEAKEDHDHAHGEEGHDHAHGEEGHDHGEHAGHNH